MVRNARLIVVAAVFLAGGFLAGIYVGNQRGIPFTAERLHWSIGIYTGDSPFDLGSPPQLRNPVLTGDDVTDVQAAFVADPFMVRKDSTWYMFFEVWNSETNQGDIALATSDDGLEWTYEQVVLDEPFILSYPYVFNWKDEYYMIPESRRANGIRVYKAVDFPTVWSHTGTILNGSFGDPSVFRYDDKWWMFAENAPGFNNVLRLYYADDLMGPWIEHPESPLVAGDANIARPGGRVLVLDDGVVRYTQDDDPTYGNQVRAFKITQLTTTNYEEREVMENPILNASGNGWNGKGMHHVDAHKIGENSWIASVDGLREVRVFGVRY